MSKNKKTSKTTAATASTKHVGRPKYQPVFPRTSKWSFLDFAKANGVDTTTLNDDGDRIMKGTKCTVLTLRHFLDRDMYHMTAKNKPDRTNPRRNSLVVLTDELGKSTSANGLGRKSYLFQLRAKAQVTKTAKVAAPKTPKTKDVSKETQDYETKKAELLAPTPAVTITPAVVETAPVVETPAVVETAPVAAEPASDTAPVVETAPVVPAADPVTA